MNDIELIDAGKSYGSTKVIENLNLRIRGGERMVLLGPSGCGKSTMLRMIAGLEKITSGTLLLNGKDSTKTPSGLRDMAMVFQNYALYPNMNVEDNITFGLKANRVDPEEIGDRLEKVLKMLRLEKYRKRLPKDLSGGQRQRVALARAVVKRSRYFLLDEPLSNLDVTLRHEARKELVQIHETYGQTFVYVTHDQVEAMTLGQRIVLMNEGQIQMVGTPSEVYHYPENLFTASFIGSPRMNLVDAELMGGILTLDGKEIQLGDTWRKYLEKIGNGSYVLGIRPEHMRITEEDTFETLEGTVSFLENLGPHNAVTVKCGTLEFIVLDDQKRRDIADRVQITFSRARVHLFSKDTGRAIGHPEEYIDKEER